MFRKPAKSASFSQLNTQLHKNVFVDTFSATDSFLVVFYRQFLITAIRFAFTVLLFRKLNKEEKNLVLPRTYKKLCIFTVESADLKTKKRCDEYLCSHTCSWPVASTPCRSLKDVVSLAGSHTREVLMKVSISKNFLLPRSTAFMYFRREMLSQGDDCVVIFIYITSEVNVS